jgi:hypothetical protein
MSTRRRLLLVDKHCADLSHSTDAMLESKLTLSRPTHDERPRIPALIH